jgi:hypothetical protein
VQQQVGFLGLGIVNVVGIFHVGLIVVIAISCSICAINVIGDIISAGYVVVSCSCCSMN